jgi:hypothetical protein
VALRVVDGGQHDPGDEDGKDDRDRNFEHGLMHRLVSSGAR